MDDNKLTLPRLLLGAVLVLDFFLLYFLLTAYF